MWKDKIPITSSNFNHNDWGRELGDVNSLGQHKGRARTLEAMREKKEYLSKKEKERGKTLRSTWKLFQPPT